MRTKSPKSEPKSAETSAPPVVPNPSAPAPIVEEKVNRISIPLNKDGKIEWDSMRSSTQAKVKELMGVSDTKGSESKAVEVFDPAWTGAMFDTIGKIESFAAVKMYGFPPEVADKAFTYSQAEKDKLAGPTAKVINKYAPVWLEQFKDEIALAMLFVTITAMKFQMASMLAAQMKKASERPAPAPKVVDMPTVADLSAVEREIHGVDAQGNITYKDEQKN